MGIADLTTHQNFLTATIRGLTDRFFDRAGATEIDVSIKSGMQAGASRRIRQTRMLVGSGPENDLTLLDDAVKAQHLELEFQRSAFGLLVDVTATGPGIRVAGRPLEQGQKVTAMPVPLEVIVEDTVIQFDRVASKRTRPKTGILGALSSRLYGLDPIILIVSLVLFGLLLGSFITSVMSSGGSRYGFTVQDRAPINAAVVTNPNRDWQNDLTTEAFNLGLKNDLAFAQAPDGMITVTGSVPQAKSAALGQLQTWYDGQPLAPTIIWGINRQASLANMPNISMIRISEPAHVLLSSGNVASIGDELVDQWVLAEINENELVLTRGTERTVISHSEIIR